MGTALLVVERYELLTGTSMPIYLKLHKATK
jgi:hypothetical protein